MDDLRDQITTWQKEQRDIQRQKRLERVSESRDSRPSSQMDVEAADLD